tara:strand:- start:1038 stop:1514 length:477 start_codon:yes stop_codon:yes gene_type:complete
MSFIKDNDNDNYETNKSGWENIKQYIPKNKIIWSPFYCDGKQKEYFKELGFDIIHEDKDFFSYTPDYDLIIDNPPFSKLRSICEKLKQLDKPFIMIMPSSKINAVWFQKMFHKHLQIIIPLNKKINFTNINPDITFNFNWGIYYFCYKINLNKDLIFI